MKFIYIMAVAITAVLIVQQATDAYFTNQQTQRDRETMLILMRGGIPALEARCIIETNEPEQIAPCIKLGTPTGGTKT